MYVIYQDTQVSKICQFSKSECYNVSYDTFIIELCHDLKLSLTQITITASDNTSKIYVNI